MSADWRGCAGGRYGGKRIPSRTESKRGVRCGAWCKILCKRKSTKSQRYDRSVIANRTLRTRGRRKDCVNDKKRQYENVRLNQEWE